MKKVKEQTRTTSLPPQTMRAAEKKAQFGSLKEFRKSTVDYYLDYATTLYANNRTEVRKMYRMYNGELIEEDYDEILKMFQTKGNKITASSIKNFNIIKPQIDTLLGEFTQMAIHPTVKVLNEDVITRETEALKADALSNMRDEFAQLLIQAGIGQKELAQQVESTPEVVKRKRQSWRDARAEHGQNALNAIVEDQEVLFELKEILKDFLISGESRDMKRGVEGRVIFEKLNPLNCTVIGTQRFVEDCEAVIYHWDMSLSEIVKMFPMLLTPKIFSDLQELDTTGYETNAFPSPTVTTSEYDFGIELGSRYSVRTDLNRRFPVKYVCYKTNRWLGFLTFTNLLGETQTAIVQDGFKLTKEQKELGWELDWQCFNDVAEGFRIGNDIYLDLRDYPFPRRHIDDWNDVKLPINGINYSHTNAANTSLCKLGENYQILYNIFFHRTIKAISRAKDALAMIDAKLMPGDWELGDWFKWMDDYGYILVDYDNARLSPQHQSVLKLGYEGIKINIDLLRFIKLEWEELSGINRQRMGEIKSSDGLGTTNQAVQGSINVTANLYADFFQYVKRNYQGLLDISKEVWEEGEIKNYTDSDSRTHYFKVGKEHTETSYGIYIGDPLKEQRALREARSIMGNMSQQQGAKASSLLDILFADSSIKLKELIKTEELIAEQMQQEAQQAEQQAKQAELTQKAQEAKDRLDMEYYKIDKTYDGIVDSAALRASMGDTNDNNIPDVLEMKERIDNMINAREKLNLEKKKLKQDDRHFKEEMKVKRQKGTGI